MKRLLLVSSSTVHGTGYLDHCADAIRSLFAPVGRVLFVPYALKDRDGYADKARERFRTLGLGLDSVHLALDAREAVEDAGGFFIGGGNTFRLLKELYDQDLLAAIRRRVEGGAPYMGTSAGSNVAAPTIRTTNDMPIVQPPSFDALGVVPFQINPHYQDPAPDSTHMGETRDQRLAEYLEENERPVLALREGAWLARQGGSLQLLGARGAKLFARGRAPLEIAPGTALDHLLA